MKVMEGYLVNPDVLVSRAKGYIAGFNDMVKQSNITTTQLNEIAVEVAQEWTDGWDEDQGFGSSDGTFMLKDFIDTIIASFTNKQYTTAFRPTLQVIVE